MNEAGFARIVPICSSGVNCIDTTSKKSASTASFASITATRTVGEVGSGGAGDSNIAGASSVAKGGLGSATSGSRSCAGLGFSFGIAIASGCGTGAFFTAVRCFRGSAANVFCTSCTSASDKNGFSMVATTFSKRRAVAAISATCPDIISTGTRAVRSFCKSRSQTSSPFKSGKL